MPSYLPCPDITNRESVVRILRDSISVHVRCIVGTETIISSHCYGEGREHLARSIVNSFLNGEFDGSVHR